MNGPRRFLKITNLVAESKGLLRLEGNCIIAEAGGISGALRVGVTPQTFNGCRARESESSL